MSMTIRELAIMAIRNELRIIFDYASDDVWETELWKMVENDINPLLIKHGEQPVTPEDFK